MNQCRRMLLCSVLAALGVASVAGAQGYPSKPIRLLVGFPPGGNADVIGRIVGRKMSESLGQPIVIDNRPGAGSIIASEMTARAAPDGYTLVMIGSTHAVNAGLYPKLPYHPVNDFAAIALTSSSPVVLTAHPSVPAKTLGELMALARQKPGELTYASAGVGGINHLAAEMWKRRMQLDIVHVPYKGVAQALPPVIAGEVRLLMSSLTGVLPQLKAGRLKAIAVTTLKRVSGAPDIPTMDESGVPGFEASSWSGLLAPAGTPQAVIARLNAEAVKALASSDVREAIIRTGAEPNSSTPEHFHDYLQAEVEKWKKAVRESGVRPAL